MKKIITYLFILTCLPIFLRAQNVAINGSGAAPRNCAMLDILSSNTGLLIPTVVLTNVTTYAPLTGTAVNGLLVYSSAAPTNGNGSGYYYWSTTASKWINLVDNLAPGDPWYTNGNTGTTPSSSAYGTAANNNFIGTTDNTSFVFVCNNLERMRINPLDGEVVIGAQTSGLPGDLLCGVSTFANPWATNGYSAFDGGATYGQITSGTTIYGAVQGEYNGTNNAGTGVRGSIINNTAGTSLATIISGVNGISTTSGSYKFGVYGTGATSLRSGGVLGNDYGLARGALGYYASNGLDYSVYGFGQAHTNGVGTGKMASGANMNTFFDQPNTNIGLGIYGGVMGGWIKGLVYGTNFSGQKYGVYVHGNTITNDKYVQLNNSSTSDVRIASYATTALTNELTSKGKINLVNGQVNVSFDSKLIELCDLNSLVITATPMGNCNGVYIDDVTESGFSIKEINSGVHNVSVNFIISGTLKLATEFTEVDILNKQYETNMSGVMHNDNDDKTNGTPIWYDGANVRHDAVDEELTGRRALKEAQAKENEKFYRPKEDKNDQKK